MNPEELEAIAVERRSMERRTRYIDVRVDRRQSSRRAIKLSPTSGFAGVALVVDAWPLMRAGMQQTLRDMSMRVAGDAATFAEASMTVGDRLDLAVIGATNENIREVAEGVRRLPGHDGALPRVLILLDHIEVADLRYLLGTGVEGLVQRSINLDDLRAACERVMAGTRVLSGGPLSVLASAGLQLTEDPISSDIDDDGLTRKELEVLSELAHHRSNKEIADHLHVSSSTIKTHLSSIYTKLGVADRRQAVVAGVERGLLI